MCDAKSGFKFCTCVAAAGGPCNPEYKMPEYVWHLKRFAGLNDSGVMGTIVGPAADLGQGLSIYNVLQVLNSGEAFDFTYSPEENDSLNIGLSERKEGYVYMSFLYKAGQWSPGMHSPFSTKTEEIASGNVFREAR